MTKKITQKYLDLIPEKRIASRMAILQAAGEVFEKVLPQGMEITTTKALLHAVVVSHFLDVERFKDFHCGDSSSSRISYPKIAAFMIKWVSKLRPYSVQLRPEIGVPTKEEWDFYSVRVNALMAPLLYAIFTSDPPFEDSRIVHELHIGNMGSDALVLLLEKPNSTP